MKKKNTKIELNRFIANNTKYSRRKATKLIKEGHVQINKKTIDLPFHLLNPNLDKIKVFGNPLKITKKNLVYYLLNKPRGYVSSTQTDSSKSKPVTSLIDEQSRIYPVGRLDIDSEGLLLLTNDGDLTYQITHPSSQIEKEYKVKVKGNVTSQKVDRLEKGIPLKKETTKPCKVSITDKGSKITTLNFILTEGKNRQIRRMLAYVDLHVTNLIRTRIGNLKLGNLQSGNYRKLSKKEISSLIK